MPKNSVQHRGTMRVMQEVPLSDLLRRHRGERSMREMARLTGISVNAIKALEDGDTALPAKTTMPLLARAYGVALDDLALAAYGLLFEDVPTGVDDTPDLDDGAPPESNAAAWRPPGRRQRLASALT